MLFGPFLIGKSFSWPRGLKVFCRIVELRMSDTFLRISNPLQRKGKNKKKIKRKLGNRESIGWMSEECSPFVVYLKDVFKSSDEPLHRPCSGVTKGADSVSFDASWNLFQHRDLSQVSIAYFKSLQNALHPSGTLSDDAKVIQETQWETHQLTHGERRLRDRQTDKGEIERRG